MPVESFTTFTTDVDNIRQDSPEWVTKKIETELQSLQKGMFYTVKEDGSVDCDMTTVKSYLENIKDLDWGSLKEKGSAWVMSVQIALESLKYDVGVIDGQFGSKTRNAVRKFQEDCGFNGKDLDGYPGKMTIGKLLEKLPKTGTGTEAGTSTGTETKTSVGTEVGTSTGTETKTSAGTEVGTSTGTETKTSAGTEIDNKNKAQFSKETYNALYKRAMSILTDLELRYATNGGYGTPSQNPEFTVVANGGGDTYVTKTFDFHDFVDGNKFLEEKFKNTIRTEMEKAVQEASDEKNEVLEARSFADIIRGKKYSVEDLGLDTGNTDIITLMNEFRNNKVHIDWHTGNTFYNEQTKKFHIKLDRIGLNNKERCKQEISREDLKDNSGSYSEEVFKSKLTEILQLIAKNNFSI